MPDLPGTEITIRAFEPTDWEALCEVYAAAARCEMALSHTDPRAFRPMSEEEDLEQFQGLHTVRVACVGGRLVGFVAWRDRGEWRNSGYLSWLYVDPAYHRRGIGDRLMAEAMRSLGDQAWTLARLGNDPAIRLYQKYGMQIVKSRLAQTWGYPHTELRLALPTSRKYDPDVPNFGA
jgi:ribosomal protein S18 acetylase RimI-like enzyme